jgi:hypothetical protein
MSHLRSGSILATVLLATLGLASTPPSQWSPASYADQSTVELTTNCPDEGEHRFPVWVVVIDGQVYVRLGSRATARIRCNRTAPFVGVKIAGQDFERVRGIEAPESAAAVAKAMAAKYWSDMFVRFMSHPLTLRLVPE